MSAPTMTIRADTSGIDAYLDGIAAGADEAARPAAQAMAQVLVDEVRRNVAKLGRHTGNLAASIYQAYAARISTPGHATYHVSWNPRKAPHGHLVEFGYMQRYKVSFDPVSRQFYTHKDQPLATPRHVGARPFVRPAASKMPQAQAAGLAEFNRLIGKVIA